MISFRTPRVTGKEIIAALKKAGFIVVRESSSHKFLSHTDDATRHATVAVHSSKYVPVGTLIQKIAGPGLNLL